jgi:CheY-like chemotaxis protein
MEREYAKFRIMIVDDDYNALFILKNLLIKRFGIVQIVSANNGEEAIRYCQNNIFDIIFMDIRMPVIDGIETTNIIKNNNSEIIVIAHTASYIRLVDLAEAGFDDVVIKPTAYKDLKKSLDRVLAISN